ncbi:glycoside hydrolase [Ophiobolus disseminans]|uniref:Glycoside hydrolase n=1 Tax=Ophiobolus disseminans TaxID=1469910 RepID=A0A6A7A2T2_9PLEO|nr:glycoside hydrolase [Ophiobolus disseminans]
MEALVGNGVYHEQDLFYSTNLEHIDAEQFRVPWYYRSEYVLGPPNNASSFYTLRTNGISSRADIYLNGHLIADKDTQAGSYVGLDYDVTNTVRHGGCNVLLVRVYPTDYNRDLALGFVDWNPSPPDNGTGVWRDIELKRSGQVSLSGPRVTTTLDGSITIYVDVTNLAKNASASGYLDCFVHDPQGVRTGAPKNGFDLASGEGLKLSVKAKVNNPQLWWPRQWGEQPLYSVQCNASIRGQDGISDSTTTRFGIRSVVSTLNTKYNDTTFLVNNERFQVLGAGYTSDIFLRFNESKVRKQFEYVQDMGLNTVRLEGKQEHPRLYELADEMGIMLLAGWECCDKWEGWSYNDEAPGEKWTDADYRIAKLSMEHEAAMMQSHPSILGFLVGSDYWPDDHATQSYTTALQAKNWNTPIISSASQRGDPALLGNSGMKMAGPYDWVPPNYWFDPQQRMGSAGGFGSELGAGVGTPELSSLKKFLSPSDLEDLWKAPNKGLYHMSTSASSFYTREIYNTALWARFGAPTSLADYLAKAQIMDYEATKAQFEAYISRWGQDRDRPATGAIYWMLNNAWPSLHWNLFDYYLRPAGAYFGLQSALSALEHVVYDYSDQAIYIVDRRLPSNASDDGKRTVDVEVLSLEGKMVVKRSVDSYTMPNSARQVTYVPEWGNRTQTTLLRLKLSSRTQILSTNTYILAPALDTMDWDNSTWYHTPVTHFSSFVGLGNMSIADVSVSVHGRTVRLKNKSKSPALFVRLGLLDAGGADVEGMRWKENFVTLWPGEGRDVEFDAGVGRGGMRVEVSGWNVGGVTVAL